MNKAYYEKLIDLTMSRSFLEIKSFLENLPINEKGVVFEQYLKELYNGNGWIASRVGGKNDMGADILLYHPENPSKVMFIVQAKNQRNPLSFDNTRIELIKFREEASLKYNCNQYKLVSINGFVNEANKLRKFNILLEDWTHINTLIENYDPNNKKGPDIELYAHNKSSYDDILEEWKRTKKVAVVQATGTGKTYIIAKVFSKFMTKIKLILAPSKYILNQTKKRIGWTRDNTIFMTYSKAMRLTNDEIKELNVSLIILDEFHRCGAEEWGRGVNNILDSYKEAYILGTTATPVRYLDGSRDMRDELFEGKSVSNLSLAEAIIKKILPMPMYIAALYTLDEEIDCLYNKIENARENDKNKETIKKQIHNYKLEWEKTNGIHKIIKKYTTNELNKFIVFCKNEEQLDEMEWVVESWFQKAKLGKKRKKYRVFSSESESGANLEEFKKGNNTNTIYLLFCIDMLNEGLHIQDVTGVILLRPTQSPTVFYQQIGRCIQVGNEDRPIIFDFVNNFRNIRAKDFIKDLEDASNKENRKLKNLGLNEEDIQITVIDETKAIVKMLNDIDERINNWEIQYRKLVVFKEVYGHCLVPPDWKDSDLAKWVRVQRSSKKVLSNERKTKLEKLDFEWSTLDAICNKRIDELKVFKQEFGHCNVPQNDSNYKSLGKWCAGLRRRSYRCTEEQAKMLEELEFIWNPQEYIWKQRYEELKQYKKQYGHCNVPRSWEDNKLLGNWVHYMRTDKKLLTNEQIRKLNDLGFVWDNKKERWDRMFTELVEFKEEHGHCDVPTRYDKNKPLANWIHIQRQSRNKLTKEQIDKLNHIGFIWDKSFKRWKEKYEMLKKFKEVNGHCKVENIDEEFKGLAKWLKNQKINKGNLDKIKLELLNELNIEWDFEVNEEINRILTYWDEGYLKLLIHQERNNHIRISNKENYKLYEWVNRLRKYKEFLSNEIINKLDEIGFDWDPQKTAWMKKFFELKQYKKVSDNIEISLDKNVRKKNILLYLWVRELRENIKKLTEEQVDLLNSIGFVWTLEKKIIWDEKIEELKQYYKQNGDCNVPQRYKCNVKLGGWVAKIRRNRDKLSKEQVEELNSMKFDWNPGLTRWNKRFDELKKYKEEHGQCNVPKNNGLGSWVASQKARKNKLSEEQINKLNELELQWN
ncbi:Helicase associated domain protein [Lutibacter sp. B2]|nr:Helicase associated domain protein [Lutibacter sp. B2]